jgi:hypothetical protein
MNDEIVLQIRYDRALWRRAMSGWWQSVVPPVPFIQRAITWAVIWFAIGIVALAITAFGLSPYYVVAGLIGAGVLVLAVFGLQRTRMSRFWDVIGSHWDIAGTTEARFGPEGVVLADDISRRELSWAAIDAIRAARGVTVLRSGFSMIAVPDRTLPGNLTPKSFRARLLEWKGA